MSTKCYEINKTKINSDVHFGVMHFGILCSHSHTSMYDKQHGH